MIFNHTPELLDTVQQQLLSDLEKVKLSLETQIVELNVLHSSFLTGGVEISKDRITFEKLFDASSKISLLSDYEKKVIELQKCFFSTQTDVHQGKECDNIEQDQQQEPVSSLPSVVNNVIANLNAATTAITGGSNIIQTTKPFAMYLPASRKVVIYINNIKDAADTNSWNTNDLLAIAYIHEMFHVYFDYRAGLGGLHYIREIEEPLTELAALLFFENAGDQFKTIYDFYRSFIQSEKANGITAAYGFADFIYENVSLLYKKDIDSNGNKNRYKKCIRLIEKYANTSHLIDKDSLEVIDWVSRLIFTYPHPTEAEECCLLLLSKILNLSEEQEMKFSRLYSDSLKKIKESFMSRWGISKKLVSPVQKQALENEIEKCVSENIIVEKLSPWESATPIYKGGDDWHSIIPNSKLVPNTFRPFKHQVECWKALLTDDKSIVVTTGTGSGKTECFMMPLVQELSDAANFKNNCVQAIFLYPLNALMEDQRARLSKLIENSVTGGGKPITFAVYNGQTKNNFDSDNGYSFNQKLPHELVYRDNIHDTPPNILLTNPTMLEYILLRKEDEPLISSGELKWIVIDETHTYSGASADEMALLLRRVKIAYGIKDINTIKFATSSATINGSVIDFISGITGQDNTKLKKIKEVRGIREFPSCCQASTSNSADKIKVLTKLECNDYSYLQQLIPYKPDTLQRLEELDRLAEGGLKVKVHFFTKAIDNGLFTNIEKLSSEGEFEILTSIELDDTTFKPIPSILPLMHCENCGAILAQASIDETYNIYSRPISHSKSDIFNTTENHDIGNDRCRYIAVKKPLLRVPQSSECDILAGNKYLEGPGRFIMSPDYNTCPCCGKVNRVSRYNFSSGTLSRLISTTLLDSVTSIKEFGLPYNGKQFISFADSRKAAATPTLQQNLETEERWVTATLFHLLNKNKVTIQNEYLSVSSEISKLQLELIQPNADQEKIYIEINKLTEQQNNLRAIFGCLDNGYISWQDAAIILSSDPSCELMAKCFLKKGDFDDNGNIKKPTEIKQWYALGALYYTLSSRHHYKLSPENYGLLKTFYPKLTSLSASKPYIDYCAAIGITPLDEDWRDLLKIYLDYEIRTNGSLFYHNAMWGTLDISACRNLKTGSSSVRRSACKPEYNDNRLTLLLARLIGCNNTKEVQDKENRTGIIYKDLISAVLNSIWEELEKCHLLVPGMHFNENTNRFEQDQSKDPNHEYYRLNVDDIAFKLYDEAYIDPYTGYALDACFHGWSPYERTRYSALYDVPLTKVLWSSQFDINNPRCLPAETWFNTNRPEIAGLWSYKLESIYNNTSIFVQAEHTAQLDRKVTKERIKQFKEHKINILACSTTMEMGVDLGSLELVSMSTIPPHPANYKQRAGRAGRAGQNKSTCFTLCNSDTLGLAACADPKMAILSKGAIAPRADLSSPQIVQRHINSYLLRTFWNLPAGTAPSVLNAKLVDFFLNGNCMVVNHELQYSGTVIRPHQFNMSMAENSQCESFNNWLYNNLPNSVVNEIEEIINNTCLSCFHGNIDPLLQNCIDMMQQIYENWIREINDIAINYSSELTKTPHNQRYLEMLNRQFIEGFLQDNLCEYLATNQFSPNANMPIGIIELKIDKKNHNTGEHCNPSRDLRTALSEYIPGKSVTIDDSTYRIAGVEWKDYLYIKKCSQCGNLWDNQSNNCPVCGSPGVSRTVITPVSFLPDNETTRNDELTSVGTVKAALLGAEAWRYPNILGSLFALRGPNPNMTPKILYYNDGNGYGFCVCGQCSSAFPETSFCQNDGQYIKNLAFPIKIADTTPGNTKKQYKFVHNNPKVEGRCCEFDATYKKKNTLSRNIVIGGTLQTDFCEILLFNKLNAGSIQPFPSGNKVKAKSIATTLGIMICDLFAKHISINREDIDFILSENNNLLTICIFDTAKGGAGYSCQLNDAALLQHLLDECKHILNSIILKTSPIDIIFTKSTIRYLNDTSILDTYHWLEDEYNERIAIPSSYTSVFGIGNVTTSNYSDLVLNWKTASAGTTKQLCFQSSYPAISGKAMPDFGKWNLDEGLDNWQTKRHSDFFVTPKIDAILFNPKPSIPFEASIMYRRIEGIASFVQSSKTFGTNIVPLAIIGNTLFFTDKVENAQLNEAFASGLIFRATGVSIPTSAYKPAYKTAPETKIPTSTSCESGELLDLLIKLDAQNSISGFISNAQNHPLKFEYSDEHLKHQLGMIMLIKMIKNIISLTNCNSYSIDIYNEKYDTRYQIKKGYSKDDSYRHLLGSLIDNTDRDALLTELLGKEFSPSVFKVESLDEYALPHWRCLSIKDLKNGLCLKILPNGGIGNGWRIENNRDILYDTSLDSKSSIPIKSDSKHEILFNINLE